jgi:glycosyltransferase involved in cell wall biosynthesis
MKVSLVATVKDAGPFIGEFLGSVRSQTRQPDEVVIVDGGSIDGTFEVLEQESGVTAILEPAANIARGRNVAVRAAAHDVIAVTDADCILAPDWLMRIVVPIQRGSNVVAGAYRPLTSSLWQVCATAHVPDPDEITPGWMPSSRSLAFRREAFDAAGGYPEWLDVGEDMYLNHRWVELGVAIEVAPEAVTYWRGRPTLAATWSQYAGYAEGDAIGGMYPKRHLIRFGTYAGGGLALASGRRLPRLLAMVAGAGYVRRPIRRAWRRVGSNPASRAGVLLGVPLMTAFLDAAKMWGYLRGLTRRGSR